MNKKNIAVITGASSGIGKEFAKLLCEKNNIDEIWAISRNKDKLEALENELGEKVRIFSVDLSDNEKLSVLEKALNEEQPRISYLINSAGYARFCSYSDLNITDSLNMINLNVGGVVAMGLMCIPYMDKGSKILNIASQSAFQPLPYLNIYSATKAFVRNYSRALNVELKERGIGVTAVCPGWMKTDLINNAKIGAEKTTNNFFGIVAPDKVARKALRDTERGKDISVYSIYVKTAHLIAKILPQKIMMKLWLWQQRM